MTTPAELDRLEALAEAATAARHMLDVWSDEDDEIPETLESAVAALRVALIDGDPA